MKIRTGFVSNSSSSSFIIASKEKLTKERLMEYFNVDKNSPLYTIAKDISKVLVESGEEVTYDSMMNEYDATEEDMNNWWGGVFKKAKSKDLKYIYEGRAGNDGDAIENMICEMDISYDGDDLIIWKEGGY